MEFHGHLSFKSQTLPAFIGSEVQCWRGQHASMAWHDAVNFVKLPAPGASRSSNKACDQVALFWGRLDNGSEIAATLAITDSSADLPAQLVVHAYRRWGEDFLDYFAGDFCCALWDGLSESLILGRDATGKRPLLVHDSGKTLYFATDIDVLFAISGAPRKINGDRLAEWLAWMDWPSAECSWYTNMSFVPPGHVLVANKESTRLYRYWRPEEKPTVRFQRSEEYVDAVRESLETAVSCRLPATGHVATTLSGGLDSTSVTALAARQLASQGRRLTAFTAVPQTGFDGSAPFSSVCNEGPLASLVASQHDNIDHVLIPNSARPLLGSLDAMGRVSDEPRIQTANATWLSAIYDGTRDCGANTLLIGQQGNVTASYEGALLHTHLLTQGRLFDLANEWRCRRQSGHSWAGLAMGTIAPLLSTAQRKNVRSFFGAKPERTISQLSCLNSLMADTLQSRFNSTLIYGRGGNSRRYRLVSLTGPYGAGQLEAGLLHSHGFSLNDPMADKRLIELCLSIPEDQFQRNGEKRWLMRRLTADLLPPEVVNNPRLGLQSADTAMVLRAAAPELRAQLQLFESNQMIKHYLDLPRMRQLLDQVPQGNGPLPRGPVATTYFGLIRAFAAGLFILRVEEKNARVMPLPQSRLRA